MPTSLSPVLRLESLPQEVHSHIVSFLGCKSLLKDVVNVMSLNRYFREVVMLYMNHNDVKTPLRVRWAKRRCLEVCEFVVSEHSNIIVQILLLLGQSHLTPTDRERLIDTIVLYAKNGTRKRNDGLDFEIEKIWTYPFMESPFSKTMKPRNLLKRLYLYTNAKKQFDYLVDDMKKHLMRLNWKDFRGHTGQRGLAYWVHMLNGSFHDDESPLSIRLPHTPSIKMEATFRLSFIENVLIPLGEAGVVIPLPNRALETIYDFCSPTPRESSFYTGNHWDAELYKLGKMSWYRRWEIVRDLEQDMDSKHTELRKMGFVDFKFLSILPIRWGLRRRDGTVTNNRRSF